MQTAKNFRGRQFLTVLSYFLFFQAVMFFQSCKKTVEPSANEEIATKRKPQNPPPPPPPFYFSDCYNPLYSAQLTKGKTANVSITKNYVNSPGGSYAAFTSATVNGITVSAPAGTFNVGSGSVVFTATGTPINTGVFYIQIQVGNIQPCMMYFIVINAPVSGPTADPGPAEGSTGIINFIYRGQSVAYQTVRAGDGKIWLQQNLGSPQVAMAVWDEASFGDYFQWGRWDDVHQVPNSPTITGGPSLLNPSNIPSGNPNSISGWWSTGGLATDTWNGTSATATNGKDPCAALGAGWRLPTAADWQNLKNYEDLEGALAAYMSNLKLPAAGFRFFNNGESFYWSATAASNSYAIALFISDNTYAATLGATERQQSYSCRCVKD
ncbi:MAG TPA: hypothetical protein VFD56_02670 [Chitinophagaceae bacterium]|nr:hypothetical protein [Chitinophagaceae bacterium]